MAMAMAMAGLGARARAPRAGRARSARTADDRSWRAAQRRAAPRAFELGDAVWLAIPGGFGALAGFSNLRILKREAEARAKLDAVDPALASDVNEENFAVPSYRYGLLSKRAAALQSGGPAAVEAEIEAQAAKDKRVRFARAGPEGSPEREAEQLRYMAEVRRQQAGARRARTRGAPPLSVFRMARR